MSANRRLEQIKQTIGEPLVKLNDVHLKVKKPLNPDLVPNVTDLFNLKSQETLAHLRWMIQKGELGQDMYLIGEPGPLRRNLALLFAQIGQREVEYVRLSRDVTDADLKQRREIIDQTAVFIDQACVRAAVHGRILILDGVEKAERNVLPILNNLLENREMSLEDGRFLVNPGRYDMLTLAQDTHLVRVSERFIVIALGLPVPKHDGYPLDPPFRSRFQARYIAPSDVQTQLETLRVKFQKVQPKTLEQLISISVLLQNFESDVGGVAPNFPTYLERQCALLEAIPGAKLGDVLGFCYPYLFMIEVNEQLKNTIQSALQTFQIQIDKNCLFSFRLLDSKSEWKQVEITLRKDTFQLQLPTKSDAIYGTLSNVVVTDYLTHLEAQLLLGLFIGDVCILGPKGSGKSMLVRKVCRTLSQPIIFLPVYKDMSSRDLLQRRSTNLNGDTVWENSGLVEAAILGHYAILDGVDLLDPGAFSSIQRLVFEREISLPDGTRLMNPKNCEKLKDTLGFKDTDFTEKKIIRVHPAFRIVALAKSDEFSKPSKNWLNGEVLSMFSYLYIRPMHIDEEAKVLKDLFPNLAVDIIHQVCRLAQDIRSETDEVLKDLAGNFSTRQLKRICNRMNSFPKECLYSTILQVCLFSFLPKLSKEALQNYLKKHNISLKKLDATTIEIKEVSISNRPHLDVGGVVYPIKTDTDPSLVPKVTFYENQRQFKVLEDILKDFIMGEHILLVGNQGVGKNKIVDYFLQRLNLPREYIQLHRDTTVSSLTSCPTIVDGFLTYEDSPLVKAAKNGYILIIDEADKAPIHVTSVLKSLVEAGEMVLADSRRLSTFVDPTDKKAIQIHPNFRMFVLANRPGYPFLGNNFFGSIGDVYATHCVDNPDLQSELVLLKNYGPDVPEQTLQKLIAAFTDLRDLVDEGVMNYPYSTRELVNIVKHLQAFPDEGVSIALKNIFDFDMEQDSSKLISEIMNKNGFPLITPNSEFKIALGKQMVLKPPVLVERWDYANQAELKKSAPTALTVRGSWKLDVPTAWENQSQKNERANSFSELLYTFDIQSAGAFSDVTVGRDGLLYAITIAPVHLYILSPDHRQRKIVDLYEYIPSNRGVQLILYHLPNGIVCVHNSQEHSLLLVDLKNSLITTVVLQGLDPTEDSSIAFDTSHAMVYQKHSEIVLLIDFDKMVQIQLQLGVRLLNVFSSSIGWIIEDVQGNRLVMENNVLTSLNISEKYKQGMSFLSGLGSVHNNSLWKFSTLPRMFGSRGNIQKGSVEWYAWLRNQSIPALPYVNLGTVHGYLYGSNQIVNVIPWEKSGRSMITVELLDMDHHRARLIDLSVAFPTNLIHSKTFDKARKVSSIPVVRFAETSNAHVVIMDQSGHFSVVQALANELDHDLKKWSTMTGATSVRELSIQVDPEHPDSDAISQSFSTVPGEGQESGSGSGSGGGEGDGDGSGTGQGESGSGLAGGPGNAIPAEARTSGTVDSSFQLRSPGELAKEIDQAQKQLHMKNLKNHLQNMKMTEKDYQNFTKYHSNVKREVHELRAILESVDAKSKERVWLQNQTSGDLDETRLVEGITGDSAIYRTRGDNDDPMFFHKPKRMYFVFDLSASMMRFNGHDSRMDRSLETAIMLMEAFKGFEHKFEYKFFGHSGDGPAIDLMGNKPPPKNEKEMFDLLAKMQAHAAYCISGDNSVLAISSAVKGITKEEADDYFVLVLSDANLNQYNIGADSLNAALKADSRVNSHIVFIGNIGDQANRFVDGLSGNAFMCLDTKALPKIIKTIFVYSLSK